MRKLKGFSIVAPRVPLKHISVDIAVIILSLYASLYLRVGYDRWNDFVSNLNLILPIILSIRIGCLITFRCYQIMWRYISAVDVVRISKALALSAVLIVAVSFFFKDYIPPLPRSVYIIDSILVTLGLLGARILRRVAFEGASSAIRVGGQRTLIFGSGHNGRSLAQRFKADDNLGVTLIGFIDDDPKKKNLVIQGVPVLGTHHDLELILEKHQVNQLIVAIPDVPGSVLTEVVMIARKFNIKPRITPKLREDMHAGVEVFRDIQLTDLLNRSRRDVDLSAVREMIRGKRVLITGAGGSIGSELARQIFSYQPSKLLLLDHSEFNLYTIDRELRTSSSADEYVLPLLLDLKDAVAVRTAMKQHAPEIIFHAAAYKHVHLVESNPYSAILNNTFSTQTLVDAAAETGVEVFVLISTDKAVNPAGVMGATKRVCELLTTAKAIETGKHYCSVRFGNVLGSSGSLIPLLNEQISKGGPVTVTHQDMTRYFMLIPEAVSLVLKAATIARPGDINVLKMGEPVRIVDVARSLIALHGKTEKEIPIIFTGLRPGEKMFEELYLRGDELKTEHPDIVTLPNGDSTMSQNSEELKSTLLQINTLIAAAKLGNNEALFKLNDLVKSKYLTAGASHEPPSNPVVDLKHRQ